MGAVPWVPIAVVDFAPLGADPAPADAAQLAAAAGDSHAILIGRCTPDQVAALQPVAGQCALTLTSGDATDDLPAEYVAVADPDVAVKELVAAVSASPMAAVVLNDLLRASAGLDVGDALVVESATYSMLLAGPEFAAWRSGRERQAPIDPTAPVVDVSRDGDVLTVTLNRPERHNAFGRWLRDATCDALDVAILDPSVTSIRLAGAGPSFCSGGDLDEFGTQPDVVLAHLLRLDRSVGRRLHRLADRTVVELHGACVGAGIELPAFAGQVVAREGTWCRLPELSMGLIPGAGGTVSLPRRIGRWRTAYLALSGVQLDLDTALAWGLVDRRVD